MRTLIEKYSPLREGEGAGAGGGNDPAAGGGAAGAGGDAAGAGASAAAGPGAEGGAAAAGGDAAAAAAAAAAGQPYRPQGLPETMFGKDDRETMDRMAEALNGYRTRDATRNVPDKADAYMAFDLAAVDDSLKPHIEGLTKDPLYKAVADVALAEKVPVGSMQKIVSTLYSEAIKAGVFEGFVDVAAERSQLVPESAKALPKAQQDAAIDARMQENVDFLNLLAQPGPDGKPKLDPKVAQHAELMLMDTAAGNQFLEFFRSQMTGADKGQPFNGNGGADAGANKRAELRELMRQPEYTFGDPKFDKAKYDQLMEAYRKLPAQ